jgi:hypothetical protein
MRNSKVILFGVMAVFFYIGCTSTFDIEEIKRDLIGRTINFSMSEYKIVSIEKIKIIKRLTDRNKRVDEVYLDITFVDGNNRKWRIRECPLVYRLYNDGWGFERFGYIRDKEIVEFSPQILLPEIPGNIVSRGSAETPTVIIKHGTGSF